MYNDIMKRLARITLITVLVFVCRVLFRAALSLDLHERAAVWRSLADFISSFGRKKEWMEDGLWAYCDGRKTYVLALDQPRTIHHEGPISIPRNWTSD